MKLKILSHHLYQMQIVSFRQPSVLFSTSSILLKKARKPPKYIPHNKIVSDYELDRISKGLPRTGTEYGPLTDKPDWTYVDGQPGAPTSGQITRKMNQHNIAHEICNIRKEFDFIQDKTAVKQSHQIEQQATKNGQ